MSHNLTLNSTNHTGKFWFALCDRNGKVRDWTQGNSLLHAIWNFHNSRKYGMPQGYQAEKRGKVETAA